MAASNATPSGLKEHAAKAQEFFSLNAKYLVAPDATLAQIMEDMGCLLSVSLDAFESMSETFGKESPGYAALYALRQASALYDAAERRTNGTWHPEASS